MKFVLVYFPDDWDQTLDKKQLEGIYLAHGLRGQSTMAMKAWPQVHEMDDHIMSSDKKQSVNRSGNSPRYLPPPVRFHNLPRGTLGIKYSNIGAYTPEISPTSHKVDDVGPIGRACETLGYLSGY